MIGILFFTCALPPQRGEYAHMALRSLADYRLRSDDDDLWLHISDDGSSQGFRDEILVHAQEVFGDRVSTSDSRGRGYGASYNLATQVMHERADILLPLEDDWKLLRSFDLTSLARVLRAGHLDCIRLAYIGYTAPLRSVFESYEEHHFLKFDPDSEERHVFAGGPRLETRAFERAVGLWPEELRAGATEFEVAGRRRSREGVAWPIDLIHLRGDLFAHIGTVQAREDQREAIEV